MSRRNWMLLAVLLAQLGLVAWIYWPRPVQSTVGPLLPPLTAAQVTGLTVEDNSSRIELAQQGGQWVLASGGAYPANSLSVTDFISTVLAIDTSRLVATTPASYARLQVSDADYVRRVTLTTADGAEHVVYVGASPNAGAVHVRAGDDSNVYLTDGALAGAARTDLSGWVDTTYVRLEPSSVQQVTVTNAQGALELIRGADGQWTLSNLAPTETPDAAALQTLASRITSISLTAPLGATEQAAYGMETPTALISAVISATTPPRTVTLTVGAHDPATDSYVAKASDSDYYVRVAGFQVRDFVDATRDQLVAASPAAPLSPLPTP